MLFISLRKETFWKKINTNNQFDYHLNLVHHKSKGLPNGWKFKRLNIHGNHNNFFIVNSY
jgi:hypothetical protein